MRRYKFTFVNFGQHNKCAPPDVWPTYSLAFGLVRLLSIFKSRLSHPSDLRTNHQKGFSASDTRDDARLDAFDCSRLYS